jgi:signal transduction histidine kinase
VSADAEEPDIVHRLRNQLSVVISFCELLLADMPKDDPRYADLLEVQNAGRTALNLLPELEPRVR